MKLRHQILLVVLASVTLILVRVAIPTPPADADLTFKIGWYFGGIVSAVENLFR